MLTIPSDEEALGGLQGATIPSDLSPSIGYRIVSRAGAGTMFVSYYAVRTAPEGETPVVVKILRPSLFRQMGPSAAVIVKKEAVSLGRLNEQVPPTPFVVRLIDTGTFAVRRGTKTLDLPWITIEYVHGGVQGVTLRQRVQGTIQATGHAFDPARATRAIECISSGLSAVHDVGVVHRQLTPESILCCGSGDEELFKISDFGMARPRGIRETIMAGVVSNTGVAPPEMLSADPSTIGPWTDIFNLASVIFFLLTGEQYIVAESQAQALMAAMARTRRSILETRWLHPALRGNDQACKSIDFALRWASAGEAQERLQEAVAVAAMLSPYLRPASPVSALEQRIVASAGEQRTRAHDEMAPMTIPATHVKAPAQLKGELGQTLLSPRQPKAAAAPAAAPAAVDRAVDRPSPDRAIEAELISAPPRLSREAPPPRPSFIVERWTWSVLHHPSLDSVIRSVAWDGYGRCLAAATGGLLFWNGTSWSEASSGGLPSPQGVRFVHRIGPGRWLLGGDGSTLAVYTTGGVTGVFQLPGEPQSHVALSGDLEDMGILVSTTPNDPRPLLHAFIAKRWLRPMPAEGVALLAAVARVEDERWLLVGRSTAGEGLVALYAPLDWHMERLPAPPARAFVACAGRPDLGVGIAVGADGSVVWRYGQSVFTEHIEPRRALSAASIDAEGRAWAGSAGRIWVRRGGIPPMAGTWECVWENDAWVGPVVSLFVDSEVVVAITADGGIIEGRVTG
ncbi:serine/threonine protein kinase [Sorangium cellulosum]|uniref:serine/threonine protein kinase n=1 Tax=Sorangium cellulosum TaxID=56 RepID=UPI001651041B|nr:protein kinase [Sorangium cellulosum]